MSAELNHPRGLLDHVTLRTDDLEGTRAFLEAVLDLRPGYRPPSPFPAIGSMSMASLSCT